MVEMFNKNLQAQIILLISLVFVSCDPVPKVGSVCDLPQEEINQNNSDIEPSRECSIPEREPSANLEMNISLKDFNRDQESKMRKAIERLLIVINSKEFKTRVLDHQYNNEFAFANNNGQTNEEIYNTIMDGAESLNSEVDQEIDIDVTLYYKNNSTVGYTYPNTPNIWVNNKFFSTFSLGKVAANLTHEWTHKLGYEHDFNSTTKRSFSVPYGVGKIMQELVDSM